MRVHSEKTVSGFDELPAPGLEVIELAEAWKAARQGALIPRKRDFDPMAVPQLLPNLWIYHYRRSDDLFTCRLAGENINNAWGFSIAGKQSQDLFGVPDNAVIVSIWKTILDTPLVHYGKEESLAGNELYSAERLVLPLADETGGANFLLGLSLYSLDTTGLARRAEILDSAYHILCHDL